MPIVFTTELPDEDQPPLGNGVKDEIEIDRDEAVSNNGSVRYQLRRSDDAPEWENADSFQQFIGNFDTLVFEFVGLLDGEEYEVRGRTETSYVTGAWSEPVSIVTLFPGAVDLTATPSSPTEINLEWVDNADNEDGQVILRERRFSNGSYSRQREIGDAGADSESFADNSVQPDTEYRYQIRSFTSFTDAESDSSGAVTDDIGLRRKRVPASGWKLEIESPTGDTLCPTILEGAEYDPVLNDLPEATIPISGVGRWTDSDLEEQPARVWRDGVELPTDQVDGIAESDDSTSELSIVAGGALRQRIQIDIFENEVASVARDVIEEAGLIADVDDPDATTLADTELADVDFTDQWAEFLADEPTPTGPWEQRVNGGPKGRELVAGWTNGFDRVDETGDVGGLVDERFAAESATRWGSNTPSAQSAEWDVEIGVRIEPDDLAVSVLADDLGGEDHYGFEVFVNGNSIAEIPADALGQTYDGRYYELPNGQGLSDGTDEVLEPGTHEVRISITGAGDGGESGRWFVDGIALHPTWHWSPSGNETIEDQAVDEPPLVAEEIQLESNPITSFLTIEAAKLTSEWDSTGGNQAVALSPDGETWFEESNSETILAEFGDDASLEVQARFTLSATSEGVITGVDAADTPQEVLSAEIIGDLNDTPIVLSKSYDDRAANILNDLAERGDMIWEARPAAWVDSVAEEAGTVISVTRPGQRTGDIRQDITDYSYETRADRRAEQVVVKGASEDVRSEEWTASVSDGEGSDLQLLDRQFIINGSETVFDPETDETYTREEDYRMRYVRGSVEVLPDGDIEQGQPIAIGYRGKFVGAFPDEDVLTTGPRVVVETFSGLTSDIECEQAALYLFRQLSDPLIEADVTLPDIDPRQSLVELVDIDQLPGDEPYQLREIEGSDRDAPIRLQSRDSSSEKVADLERRIDEVADQT